MNIEGQVDIPSVMLVDHNIIAGAAVGKVPYPIAVLAMQGYEYDMDSGNDKLLIMMKSFKTQQWQSLGLVMPSTLIFNLMCQKLDVSEDKVWAKPWAFLLWIMF